MPNFVGLQLIDQQINIKKYAEFVGLQRNSLTNNSIFKM